MNVRKKKPRSIPIGGKPREGGSFSFEYRKGGAETRKVGTISRQDLPKYNTNKNQLLAETNRR